MGFIYVFKRFILSLSVLVLITNVAQAEKPIINDFYPQILSITNQSTLIIKSENLSEPLTLIINNEPVQYSMNIESGHITCTVAPLENSGSVTFTIQNTDGISNEKTLTFEDCSNWSSNIPEVYPYANIEISLNNACSTQYKYLLDDNNWSDYINISNNIKLENLKDGSHELLITGIDMAKNSFNPEPWSFTINTTEPEVNLHNLPKTLTTDNNFYITVTAGSGDPVEYLVRLNGTPDSEMHSISDPIELTSLNEGVYTLCVTSVNDLGLWQTLENANCHTWEIIDVSISNNPITPTIVLAGNESCIYTTNYTGDEVIYSWTVHNDNGDQIGETAYGNSFSFTPPETGAYAGIYSVSMMAKSNGQDIYQEKAMVKVPFAIENDQYSIIRESIFTVKGIEKNATLIWDILANENDPMEIENSENIGRWERENASSLNMTFYPAVVDKITNFWVRVSVEDDLDLTEENGLHQQIIGPFNLLPMAEFTIILSDENGLITTTNIDDITVHDMVLLNNKNLTSSDSKVVFELPDSGGIYQFSVKDNRNPPVYIDNSFSTIFKETTVVLQKAGLDTIEGSVEATDGSVLNTAQVVAYQKDEKNLYYESKNVTNGKFKIYFPESASLNDWVVVAGQEKYASMLQTNQQLNSEVLFSGSKSLQFKTVITMVEPLDDKICIRANPPFTARDQIDVYRIQKDGNNNYYDEINFDNGLITIAAPEVTDYTLIIMADTVENSDPDTGYVFYHAYRKNSSEKVIERVDSTIDILGGTIAITNENQTMKVAIPVNSITRTTTIKLEQIDNSKPNNATSGSDFIYAVDATSNQGKELTSAEINKIFITLPINLRKIQPGDIENGNWFLYCSNSLDEMEAHKTELIPVSQIIQSDYIGDGKIGSVTFWVDHLSIFAIGKPADVVPTPTPPPTPSTPSTVTLNDTDKGSDCFIMVSQNFDHSKIQLISIFILLSFVVLFNSLRKKSFFTV